MFNFCTANIVCSIFAFLAFISSHEITNETATLMKLKMLMIMLFVLFVLANLNKIVFYHRKAEQMKEKNM